MPMLRPRSLAYGLLLTAATGWMGLILLAPLAATSGSMISELIYQFFRPLCHQLAERSFQLAGNPWAVCHRCSGIYMGAWLGLVFWPLAPRTARSLQMNPRLLLLFFLPLLIDWWLPNLPASRFLSGLLAAFPASLFIWLASEQFPRSFQKALIRRSS